MKFVIQGFAASIAFLPWSVAQAGCYDLDGASIVSSDGEYLGDISSKYNGNSIFNDTGEYGNKYSSTSIFNSSTDYGSKYSNMSAFNPDASEPPVIVKNGDVVGYLTLNKYHSDARNTYAVIAECNR